MNKPRKVWLCRSSDNGKLSEMIEVWCCPPRRVKWSDAEGHGVTWAVEEFANRFEVVEDPIYYLAGLLETITERDCRRRFRVVPDTDRELICTSYHPRGSKVPNGQ